MTIPPDLQARILRFYHVEKWPVGTIAKQLRVHHTTVSRVLIQAGLPRVLHHSRRSMADPFVPFIRETLGQVPDADRQPPLRDGAGARLSRQPRPLPPRRRLPSAAAES